SEAGADCLYAPGIGEKGQIGAVVRELSPKPVNVLTLGLSMAELADLGVRRVSVGGSLARVAWGGFLAAAKEIAKTGAFTAFAAAASGRELNALFKDRI
ncbi:MAG: isocitrate lyase/phosphoenolpyruvate mutase family protein, partial [Caulobacteraceae bacterium]